MRSLFVAVALSLFLLLSVASAQPVITSGPTYCCWSIGEVNQALTATGGNGTYAWSVTAGSLPPGLAIRTDIPSYFPAGSSGLIGVATTPGTYHFTLQVTSGSQSLTQSATMHISGLVLKDLYSLPDAFTTTAYSYQLTALNNAGPVTYTLSNGALPPGVTLSPSGLLSGTPTATGNYSWNVQFTDGVDVEYRGFGVAVSAIQIFTPGQLPNATQNAAYSTTVSATGGAGGYVFTASSLPNGLTLSSSGTISGTVNAGPGNWLFTLTATDSNQVSYSKQMAIDLIGVPATPPYISVAAFNNSWDDCTIGQSCGRQVNVGNGGTAPFSWTATGLPPGMSIRGGSGVTSSYVSPASAELWGSPTASGTYNVQLKATDANGLTSTNTFPLKVSNLIVDPGDGNPPLVNGTIGTPYSRKLRVLGGNNPYSVSEVAGPLPDGLSLNTGTFVVSGTPLENGSFNVAFEFADTAGNSLQSTSYFTIGDGASTITINNYFNLGTFTTGSALSFQLSACCAAGYTWSIAGGSLPPGESLSPSGNLSGTLSTPGTYTFLVRATDTTNGSNTGYKQFVLVVTPINVTTASTLPYGYVATTYSQALAATGGTGALTWTLAPFNYLPPGLTLSTSGTISGTPTQTGLYFFNVTATDTASHIATVQFNLSIYPTAIPLTNLNPPSNLLPTGATSVNLSFNTPQATACAYSVGTLADYSSMTPFAGGQVTMSHQGLVTGLSPNPQVLNQVYIRCGSYPGDLQILEYRSVATLNPPFPRIGNIWWGSYLYATQPALAAETSLFLGTSFSAAQVTSLRAANPNILTLPSLGATYTPPPPIVTPNSYLLKDINGNPIVIWPSTPPTYLLNMTMPAVAQWAANNLFQQLSQSNFAVDGFFLDSFGTSISYLQYDAYGNPIQISSNNNGVADNPTTLDAAWKAGVLLEIDTLRNLAPNAYISCHCVLESDILTRFNGSSLVFLAVDAREGRIPFASFWNTYNSWSSSAQAPTIVNVEDSPPNQLAYGYGQPIHNMPPGVAEFGQTFYPNMRFGLATTLMNDGFFFHDFGDASFPTNWWYDEYNFSLGYPLGPAILLGSAPSANILTNGGFESGLAGWTLLVNTDANASVALDSTVVAQGNSSAHITISSASTVNSDADVSFEQQNVSLTAGTTYNLQFWARADSSRLITVNSQGGAPNYTWYGLNSQIAIGTTWSLYTASFVASTTANDARIQFWVGAVAGNVWIDGVQLSPGLAFYRRDFTNGVVLLNPTNSSQTISLESGLQRFSGSQAPKYQYIVDDTDAGFTSSGSWQTVTYDSGVIWDDGSPTSSAEALGPYYHAWQLTAHQLDASSGTAQWNLNISEDGQYTIQVWLPAAPNASTWTKNAVYEVVSGGSVVASATIDQTTASSGDGWHMIATVNLTAAGAPFLRIHNGGSGSLIADGVYVTSAALYNDGSPAPQVTLAPLDGILLNRLQPVTAPPYPPASIAVTAGGSQSATINTAFSSPLQVTVRDSLGNVVPNVTVFFAAPGSGASGTFLGGSMTATVATDSFGVGTAPAFTANGTVGSYNVTASVAGVANSAIFSLTNSPISPLLSIVQTADAASVAAGSAIGFTVQVSNSGGVGTGTATSVTLSDPLPSGRLNWSISPAYSGPGTCSIVGGAGSQTLSCTFGNLAPGASASVHVTSGTSTSSCAAYQNVVTVTATNSSALQSSAAVTVLCPTLTVSKTHSGSFTQGQQHATYQVTVSNAANVATTSGTVTVTETLPSGLTLVSMAGTGWTCPGTAANNCTRSDALAAGQSYPAITVTVNVASNATSPQVNAVAVSGGGSPPANANDSTTILPLPSTPSVSGVSPGSGSGMSQTFTFTFSDSAGWQNLGVQDILINSALDGRHACYIAYVPSGATTGSLYLIDDAGDAGGPYTGMVLPSSQTASNSQCTINGTGSSASGSGNTLTLTLGITFNSSFAGNKIFYLASADTDTGNSGWQTPGTWTVPGPPPTGPAVGGVSPARSNTLSQTYTFTFTDTNGWQDLAVLNVLINSAIDGRHACYLAYVPSGANAGSLFLVDDPGDSGGPFTGFILPGSGTAQNSQCTVGGAGSSVTATGNTLTLTLPITFTAGFAGNQVFFLAARSNTVSSDWQAVGSVTVP
jgi:uncharacterized repeat protein (TIGR01451 family)